VFRPSRRVGNTNDIAGVSCSWVGPEPRDAPDAPILLLPLNRTPAQIDFALEAVC